MSQNILQYYQKRRPQELPLYALLPLLLLLSPIILAMLAFGIASLLMYLLKEKLWPDKSMHLSPSAYWSARDVRLIVGYDARDSQASALCQKLQTTYKDALISYDWSQVRQQKLAKTMKGADEQTRIILQALTENEDESNVMWLPLGASEKDPCVLYAVGIAQEDNGSHIDFVTALPCLDDWWDPKQILPADQILTDIDKFMD